MKKKALSLFLSLVMCLTLLPTVAFAESAAGGNAITLFFTGDCDTAHTQTVLLKDHLPEDAVVTGISHTTPKVVGSVAPEYTYNASGNINLEDAKFSYTTRVLDEPASGTFIVTVSTANHGDYVFTINITLTGKYLVALSAVARNDIYDGQPHSGYSNLKGTFTSGTAYTGDYAFAYAKSDGTPLDSAPSEVGDYSVTISIPDGNESYKHKEVLTLNFSILDQEMAEAQYQAEANDAWQNGTFEQALANVYAGGTVKLLKDVVLSQTATAAKKMTITSADTSAPRTITSSTNEHGYLLNITDEVKLENVIVDGGSKNSITAKRAAIAVNGGKLTLGNGTVIQNNKNVTSNGVGGGVCVLSGELHLDGATITGNDGYFGGGVGVGGGTFYAKSGTITGNTAKIGGGVNIWMLNYGNNNITYGALHLSGTVAITENSAAYYADGIICYSSGVTFDLTGAPTIEGGIYLDHYKDGPNVSITLSELDDGADILITTFKPQSGMIMAVPASGYAITPDDFSKLRFEEDGFSLKFDDSGNVVLTDVGVYRITLNANGGSVKNETLKTAEGKLVSLPVPTRSGYTFDGWYTEESGGERVTTDTVFAADATIYAHWTYNSFSGGSIMYAIMAGSGNNGSVTVDRRYAEKGTTVTVTVTPDEGYVLETLTVTDASGNAIELKNLGDGKYSFTMPAAKVTVTATFMDDNTMLNFFVDVPAEAYYYDAVLWAAKNGITGGVDETHFAPDRSCTRAQVVTFLWRAAGCPEPTNTGSFTDVPSDAYYASAVAWAVENGIVTGYPDGTFKPNAAVSRQQTAAILYRYAQYAGMDVSVGEDTNILSFNDALTVSEYATEAFQWATGAGIVQGNNGNLLPKDTCTRGQLVAILYRFLGD